MIGDLTNRALVMRMTLMFSRLMVIAALNAGALALLSGCGSPAAGAASGGGSDAKLQISTSFYPL
jgi:hypothetical protein